MKTTNPHESESYEELLEIAFYWIQKSYMLEVEKKAILALLKDAKIPATASDLIEKMNQLQKEICAEK